MTKRKTPPISALHLLTSNRKKDEIPIDIFAQNKFNDGSLTICEVDPNRGVNWKFHDRPEAELGDIEALAKEFKDPKIGQQQPCIVRKINDIENIDYEVIVGERRWRAAKLASVKLKVVFQDMDDKQASICQIAENFNRKNLSDYAQGMSLNRLLNESLLTQKELASMFDFTVNQINRLLAFAKVPHEIWDSVGDMSNVSARTAAEIRLILKKEPSAIESIIALAPKIRDGKVGSTTLNRAIDNLKILNNSASSTFIKEVIEKDGNKLFTFENRKNGEFRIGLSSSINKLIDADKLKTIILDEISKHMNI